MNQKEMIINYIKKYGSITPLEAMKELGVMRLASRINELKKQGYLIKSETTYCKNRFGKKIHFSKYMLDN